MQFFYCKDEARVETVKKISSKFYILQPFEKVKITKPYGGETVIDLRQS